ncbi:MAG: hypothetical protein GC157_12125 [Frankiales bacterium]|nr:hypothetical protein [Frankiales bacterium]
MSTPRRAAVVAIGTVAVSAAAAFGPSQVSVEAFAASSSVSPQVVNDAARAGALAAAGSSAVGASAQHRPGAVPKPTRAKASTVAPYSFGTRDYSQWWARKLMAKRGWTSTAQFQALVKLWDHESHWNYKAHNNYSGAHGIPQALPGSKMAKIAADWRTNPITQIKWGLMYIAGRYGTPTAAWAHFLRHGWY